MYYVTTGLGLSRNVIPADTMVGAALMAVAIVASGALSDRIGRRPVVIAGTVFVVVFAIPLFLLVSSRNATLSLVAVAVAWTGAAAIYGPLGAYTTEIFGVNVRYTGAGVGYQIGAVLGGGLAPTIATALYAFYGVSAVGVYAALAATLSLICVVAIRPKRVEIAPV